jgi:triosephosphate isomerase
VRTLDDLDVEGKRVLLRVDFNVPLESGRITDDARIRAALPTLQELRDRGARLLLAAHLGRPKGRDEKLSLRPAAERLSELLGEDVELAPSLDDVPGGDVVMLENLRFEPGEIKNDSELARRYAALADAYVNDAFGAAHRAHASTEAVAHLLPSAAGRLLEREVTTLTGILRDPERPLVAVVGGAKVTDKIGVLDAFLRRADRVLVGGAMCFPFFKAQGHDVGSSLCEEEGLEPARRVLGGGGEKLRLPGDLVAGREFSADTEKRELDGVDVPDGWMGLDIGRRSASGYAEVIRDAGLLERPDGRVRARAVRGGHAHGRGGGRGVRRRHGRRRRRLGRGAGAVRAGRPRHAPLHRRRRIARADRGQAAAGRRGARGMSRTRFIAGNWKMHKTVAEAEQFIGALLPRVAAVDGVEIVVCPPFLSLQPLVDSARGSQVEIYAQTMHEADQGAFTGEISSAMLGEIDVDGVILGHSERREYFNETDRALQLKVPKALEVGLTPILCVGETEEERERGETERKLRHQVQEGLEKVPAERLPEVVVAYEPIWAIGTGRVATPEQAQEAVAFVRALVAAFDRDAAEQVRILYGGSFKPDNAAELLALPDVDGALVGGASLDAADFGAIVEIAAAT